MLSWQKAFLLLLFLCVLFFQKSAFANTPPNLPSQPSPADASTDMDPQILVLSWSGGDPNAGDSVSYEIYFGTSESPTSHSSTASPFLVLRGLSPMQTYYWRVTAKDQYGASAEGPLWSFTTGLTQLIDKTYSEDTILTKAASPYVIQGDLTVNENVTLTIEAGVILKFGLYNSLIVNGTLVARGDAGDEIIFTSYRDDEFGGDTNGDADATQPAPADWSGIDINIGPNTTSVDVEYCRIQFALTGLEVQADGHDASVRVSNSTMEKNGWYGIRISADNSSILDFDITENQIRENGSSGLSIYGNNGFSTIRGNTIQGNGSNGLYLSISYSESGDLNIIENTIQQNQSRGMYLVISGSDPDHSSRLTIQSNTIHESGNGIYLHARNLTNTPILISDNDIYQGTDGIDFRAVDSTDIAPLIEANTIHGNSGMGLSFYSGSEETDFRPQIRGNQIYDNGGHGISCLGRSSDNPILLPTIYFNSVRSNGGRGVYCDISASAMLFHNEIDNNAGGVYLATGNGARLYYNDLGQNNGGYQLENGNDTVIDARFNFWGDATTAEIQSAQNPRNLSTILDRYDDPNLGTVYYAQWLTAAAPEPTGPVSYIVAPVTGTAQKSSILRIEGIAVSNGVVDLVEVSLDNGVSWQPATGKDFWSFESTLLDNGTYTILSRVTDDGGLVESPGSGVTVTINSNLPVTTSGTLLADETWSGDILLTGDVIVPAGIQLTIQAGSVVRQLMFNDDQNGGSDSSLGEIIVHGSLVAEDVLFTSSNSIDAAPGHWGGIHLMADTADASLSLTDCIIEYGDVGILASTANSNLTVNLISSTIRNNSSDGLRFEASYDATISVDITGNQISQNGGYGIFAHSIHTNADVVGSFSSNTIAGNGAYGVYVYAEDSAASALNIIGNTIHDNPTYGIYLRMIGDAVIEHQGQYVFQSNTVYNSDFGIYLYVGRGQITSDIIGNEIYQCIEGLYLGAGSQAGITTRIIGNEIHDNSARGLYSTKHYNAFNIDSEIRSNRIYNNTGNGIEIRHLQGTSLPGTQFSLNSIYDNGGYGIYLETKAAVGLAYNDIHSNAGGVYLNAPNGSRIHYNNLHDNGTGFGVYNASDAPLDAQFNFWGSTVVDDMTTGDNPKNISVIYDLNDAGTLGFVNYMSWLTAPVQLPDGPQSQIVFPISGRQQKSSVITIRGIAVASEGVDFVEISPDNGTTWIAANGKTVWSLAHAFAGDGTYTILSRITDNEGNVEIPMAGVNVTIDSALPTTSGTLTADETWDSDLILTGDVTVPPGVTLTVSAGAKIYFQALVDDQAGGDHPARTELIVQGLLAAENTSFSSSRSADPVAGDWGGIHVDTLAGAASLVLQGCMVEYGQDGINLSANAHPAVLDIRDTTVRRNLGIGIAVSGRNGAALTVDLVDNQVQENGGYGLYGYTADPATTLDVTSQNNAVNNNGSYGVNFLTDQQSTATLDFSNNTIFNNQEYGIYLSADADTGISRTDYSLKSNTIHDSGYGIYLDGRYSEMTADIVDNILEQVSGGIKTSLSDSANLTALIAGNDIDGGGINCSATDDGTVFIADIRNNILSGGIGISSDYYMKATIEPRITLNKIQGGLHCEASSSAEVFYNDIQGELYLKTGGRSKVHYNNLTAIENGNASHIDAEQNYWGEIVTTEIENVHYPADISAINDRKGRINYRHWLNAPVEIPSGPASGIILPIDGSVQKFSSIEVQGIAVAPRGVDYVEVSTDNGVTWSPVAGIDLWNFSHSLPGSGTYTILSRAVDKDGAVEIPGSGNTIVVDYSINNYSGTLNGDTTWQGKVVITGDVSVPADATLAIEDGTVIRFSMDADDQHGGNDPGTSELIVAGALIANNVTFTSSAPDRPLKGDWGGIHIVTGNTDTLLKLHNCIVESGAGITVNSAAENISLDIRGSVIQNNTGDGINLYSDNAQTIDLQLFDNQLLNNDGDGLYIDLSSVNAAISGVLDGNTFIGNGSEAVYFHNDSPGCQLDIHNNVIQDHRYHGIWLDNDSSGYFSIVTNSIVASGTALALNARTGNVVYDIEANELSYGRDGMHIWAHYESVLKARIVNNRVYGHSEVGISCLTYSTTAVLNADIRGNLIYMNNGPGIECDDAYSLGGRILAGISSNAITDNGGWGINCEAGDPVYILYNKIQGNAGGVSLAVPEQSLTRFNDLHDNDTYDLENRSLNSVDARNNYWGADTLSEMESGGNPKNIAAIYDTFDGSVGTVDYAQWLTTPVTSGSPDGDYLPVTWDIAGGLDANDTDGDGDHFDDITEFVYWERNSGWNADPDGDGLLNLWDPDADNDGIDDGVEVASGTDPSRADDKPASVYGHASEGSTAGWSIYDGDPANASITVVDDTRPWPVIQLTGQGMLTGFQLRKSNGDSWNHSDHFIISWQIKTSDFFTVYIDIATNVGHRYLRYEPVDWSGRGEGEYVHYGIGSRIRDGQWHPVIRDLQADLAAAQPGAVIQSVNGFLFRGNAYLDDIKLISDTLDSDVDGIVDAEEGNLYGTDPLDRDSDSDGISDGLELGIYLTDPLLADTDGDGLPDGTELAFWEDNWNTDIDSDGIINLLDPDADGDGVLDGTEVITGFDPAVGTSNPAMVYEDAEDSLTIRWDVYDGSPAAAPITNMYDTQRGSRVVHLSGNQTIEGFRLLGDEGAIWNNTEQFILSWVINTSEYFIVYVDVQTTAGHRYLKYSPVNYDNQGTGEYVHYGLGNHLVDGQWHLVMRDLQTDLNTAQPGVQILAVNCFLFRGNAYLDDIMLLGLTSDTDRDGITDLDEINVHGTDPGIDDSDSDGILDGEEINTYGIDPLQPDTDSDGMLDGDELSYWGAMWNADTDGDGLINLEDADSDNDGALDGAEYAQGTDPADENDTPQTICEDGEDGTIAGWVIYDGVPEEASITNTFDAERESQVIALDGSSTVHGFWLLNADGAPWRNTGQFELEWQMKADNYFIIYIDLLTTAGHRYLKYTPSYYDDLGGGEYVHFGLGGSASDGTWQTFSRDLQNDLEDAQPGVDILEVNGFLIRGSSRLDNIILR